ncbi:MAG: peroxiredoxin Q/BCP [Paracoccaceae bacterium]|jgi:peroxiredoxin Q/BCP
MTAPDPAAPPAEGDIAPAFDLPTDGGGTVSLASLLGGKIVLYFYPKDDTSGCTKEAIGFSESLDAFAAAGATVIGVSKDGVKKHDAFKAKHALTVTLAADEDGTTCEAYGVWVEKSMYGRKYMGIDRATFVIGPDGRIAQAWRKVKVPGHVAAVLKAAQAL